MEPHNPGSTPRPTAALLSIGTELTEGSIRDAHGSYLAAALRGVGVRTASIVLIPDELGGIQGELKRLTALHELVVITGGLGPTSDDLTREAVAALAGVELEFHEELWSEIERRFAGRPLSTTNRKQALIPAGFTPIRNPHGTAPGFWGWVDRDEPENGRVLVTALPGPPRELRPLFQDSVLPVVLREFALSPPEELRATVFLLSESLLEQFLQENRQGRVEWGTRAEAYRIVVILRGGSAEERELLFGALESRVGPLRVRRGEVEAHELVLAALKAEGTTLSTAESCTGGLVAKLITDIAGASDYFWGTLVVYSNEAKTKLLGVPRQLIDSRGAVSEGTVRAMVHGVLEVSGSGVGCAVSGVAGPSGGTPEKPVGTVWIGVGARGKPPYAKQFLFSGDRDMVRRKSATAALLLCEATIRGKEVDKSDLWQYI